MWEDAGSSSAGGDKSLEESPKLNDTIFNDLMQECKHSAPGARLSARLRTALERLAMPPQTELGHISTITMSPEERRGLCGRTREGCAPLFVAARRGNVEVVEYLVHVCAAELEQRGLYEVPEDRSVHTVTPLWCAAVAGHLGVVRALAEAGADVDAGSDSGSTPVRSACFMTHERVVRYLVSRGADVHRANHNGGTCLINCVQSADLCAFLVERGAKVDARDVQLKTALHYAVQEHRAETVRLLLRHGADPRLRSRAGDDALRTAALKGAAPLLALLDAHAHYSREELADAYELLGATQLDELNDVSAALGSWRRATALRHAGLAYLRKRPARPPRPALQFAAEWRTPADLDAAAGDMDALRTQALLVVDRVLGPTHKDTVFRLMYRGASYADAFRYKRCVDLWTWALEIRIDKDTLLYTDTVHTACALTRLLLDARGGRLERVGEGEGTPGHADVVRAFSSLADNLPRARALLSARPVHKRQAETFDRALRCLTHLIYLLVESAESASERARVSERVRALVAADLRSAHTGDTLLHLAVSRLNVIRSTYFADEIAVPGIFPSVSVVRVLVSCGARASVRNGARSTALHVAAVPYNFSAELAELLLAAGAHLDAPNRFGDSPHALLALCRGSSLCPLRHTTLACLAARTLLQALPSHVNPATLPVPATLRDFLDLHRP